MKETSRGLVLYDSKYGNTEKVAKSLWKGLQEAGLESYWLNMENVDLETLSSYDFIAIGAPTQAFSASRPMKEFLRKIEKNPALKGKYGFAFDTKFDNRLSGSAAKYIQNRLEKYGMNIIVPRESAIVTSTEGPLASGEETRFEKLGYDIGKRFVKS